MRMSLLYLGNKNKIPNSIKSNRNKKLNSYRLLRSLNKITGRGSGGGYFSGLLTLSNKEKINHYLSLYPIKGRGNYSGLILITSDKY